MQKHSHRQLFSAYIHGEHHKFSYFLRTIPDIDSLLKPLDDVIDTKLIPSLLGGQISNTERDLFSLPIRLGGLGLPRISEKSTLDFETSKKITAPLCAIMAMQGDTLPVNLTVVKVQNAQCSTNIWLKE